jgi:hypothetical protein
MDSLAPEGLPSVLGSFTFVKDDPKHLLEEPYEVVGLLPPEEEDMRTNLSYEVHEMPVFDIRSRLDILSLEIHQFEFSRQPDLPSSLDTEEGLQGYILALLKLLKDRYQTEDVVMYNYAVPKTISCQELRTLIGNVCLVPKIKSRQGRRRFSW